MFIGILLPLLSAITPALALPAPSTPVVIIHFFK